MLTSQEPLSPLGQRILKHHQKYLPTTTAELEKRGRLHEVRQDLADRTEEQLNDLQLALLPSSGAVR